MLKDFEFQINNFSFSYSDINQQNVQQVFMVIEFINLVTEILYRFPTQLNVKCWDIIRIGLSSWVLSISKSIDKWYNSKVRRIQ